MCGCYGITGKSGPSLGWYNTGWQESVQDSNCKQTGCGISTKVNDKLDGPSAPLSLVAKLNCT